MQAYVYQLHDYLIVLGFIVSAVVFLTGGFLFSRLLQQPAPNTEKLSYYECGELSVPTQGTYWHLYYYVIALVFLLFEVEIIFLLPWSQVLTEESFRQVTAGAWKWFAFWDMSFFIGVMALGLVFLIKRKYLVWSIEKSMLPAKALSFTVPEEIYERVNEKYKQA